MKDHAVAATIHRRHAGAIHPLHAILLAFPLVLFTGAVLSDLAYSSSYEIQWTNFSSWMIAGGLAVGALALLWALVDAVRLRFAWGRSVLYFLLLLASLVVGFFNALVHAKDAWAVMPEGLILSVVAALLVLAAAWLAYTPVREGDAR